MSAFHPTVSVAALQAIVDAEDINTARTAARAEMVRLTATSPSNILQVDEAVEISGRSHSTIRRWAADHRLGRRFGGRWLLFRDRFEAFVEGGRR